MSLVILMLVDVLQWPLKKRCVMSFVRLLLLLLKCVGLSTSFLFFISFIFYFFDCIVCLCMSCSLFTAFVANKLHHYYTYLLNLLICVGHVPGMCHSTNLTVGGLYVILARLDEGDVYRPIDKEFDANNRRLLRRITTACGLQALYPRGIVE